MTQITVVKRSGVKEPLHIEKWQAQVAKVCQGIADVSQSMIEIKAQPHFYDGITTEEIDGITLRAIVDLIDVESNPDIGHTNYQYVAGKQRLSMLRKNVYGSYDVPHLYEIVKKNDIGIDVPDGILEIITGVAISSARGIIIAKTAITSPYRGAARKAQANANKIE